MITDKTPLEDWILHKINGTQSGTLTAEGLNAYHVRKLQEVIAYVREKSPFYRHHLSGVPGDAFRSLDDISKLPFTYEQDLREDPLSFLCVPQGKIARIVTLRTSGTTGEPKRLFFTDDDLELTIDFFCVGMSTLVTPGDKVLILLPGHTPDSVGDLLIRGLKRINVEGIAYGLVRDVNDAIQTIVNRKIDCLVGIPTQILALARSKEGSVIEKGMIKSVLLSTDYVPQAISNELTRRWGSPVFNHYGMTEMGLGGGVDCVTLSGYHLREGDLYFEVVHPETGGPQTTGETGEVVFTTLTRKGMPLIRYRTGDMARFIPGLCPCGTALRRMERVRGRWDGIVPVGSGFSLSLTEIDEVLFRLPWLLDYSITLTKREGVDYLETMVYGNPGQEQRPYEVLSALQEVPAILMEVEQGALQLAAVRVVEYNPMPAGPAKRRIIDNRSV